jgi:hypothetical protein
MTKFPRLMAPRAANFYDFLAYRCVFSYAVKEVAMVQPHTIKRSKTMAEKPKYYNVCKVKKTKSGKEIWTKLGVVFPHKNSDGFKLSIDEGISVSGDLVITLPKAGEEPESEE